MAKTATATRKTERASKVAEFLGLDEMAEMKPIRATKRMPPEIAEMLRPDSGVYVHSEGKPSMDFGFEPVNGSSDMWRVLNNATKGELLTGVPGRSQEELRPDKSGNGKVGNGKKPADASIAAYRPPWMDQEFLPRLVPFVLSGLESGLPQGRTFLEPRATEAERLTYPWCTIGRTVTQSNVSNATASGVLVGPNILLTAGHHVPWGATSWSMKFTPAFREGDPVPDPYGSSYVESFRGYGPPSPWQPHGYDYAICKLYQPLGNWLGTMGIQSFESDSDYMSRLYMSSGYPGNFGGRPAVQFGVPIEDVDNDSPGKELETPLYASPGWSGGPLWYYAGPKPMIVGTVSGKEKDLLDPFRDVYSGYRALIDLVQWGLDHWRP